AGAATAALKPYLTARPPGGRRLDAVAIVHGEPLHPALDLWTRNINEIGLQERLSGALSDAVRSARLAHSGLNPAAVAALEDGRPTVTQFSPQSQAGKVSLRDRLPSVAGFAMGILLWSLILTGAAIL